MNKNMFISFICVLFSFVRMLRFVKIYMKGIEFKGINFLYSADDFLYVSSLTFNFNTRLEVKTLVSNFDSV